jgi:hypothetical protein
VIVGIVDSLNIESFTWLPPCRVYNLAL